LATPAASVTMSRMVFSAVERAVADPSTERVGAALSLLGLMEELGVDLDLDRAQEVVYDALVAPSPSDGLVVLGDALGLATDAVIERGRDSGNRR
jgi:hypothetical protein